MTTSPSAADPWLATAEARLRGGAIAAAPFLLALIRSGDWQPCASALAGTKADGSGNAIQFQQVLNARMGDALR
jgi:hypothetical protein